MYEIPASVSRSQVTAEGSIKGRVQHLLEK